MEPIDDICRRMCPRGQPQYTAIVSKKYRGKPCVYCTISPSTTADHIICRSFFLEKRRIDLPKAPSCQQCNGRKSHLEHYLAAVLPFGGTHPDATVNLQTMATKRLQKNVRLRAQLISGLRQGIVQHPGSVGSQEMPLVIPIDSVQLCDLFALIARGLAWHHWQILLGTDDTAIAFAVSETGALKFERVFEMKAHDRVRINLAESTLSYEGVQAEDPPQLTCWRFSIYGGICLAGDSEVPGARSTQILGMTGPTVLLRDLQALLRRC
jgi:hypothetical protein